MLNSFPTIISIFIFHLMLLPIPTVSIANDAAAGYASGGIVLLEQKDISIEREYLHINGSQVDVSYFFKNNSDRDIKTLVAFPLPPYDPKEQVGDQGAPDIRKFSVKVNNVDVAYKTEVKAFAGDKDVTAIMKQAGLDIDALWESRFWHFYREFNSLSADQKQILIDNGLEDKKRQEEGSPSKWIVYAKYYWEQVFPANGFVHVRHTYQADTGGNTSGDVWGAYILTTARTWKMPIKEFHVIVEGWGAVSGVPLNKKGPGKYEAWIENFVPEHELMLGSGHFGSSYSGKPQIIR